MCKLFIPRSHTIQLAIHRSQQHLFFARISRVQNFSQGFFVSSGDVTRVVPSVGGGAGSRFSCVVLQTERPARHPATHLLIFSDEDFYLRLILYSFQPESMHSFTAASSPPPPSLKAGGATNVGERERAIPITHQHLFLLPGMIGIQTFG